MPDEGLMIADDGRSRCAWCGTAPEYRAYHDAEWGRPQTDDVRLFEKICLEGFQSGLSWITILRKREAFRAAFGGFDFYRVAEYGDADIERLLGDSCIVRHRGKIVSTINNARRAIEMVESEGSLARYFWSWETGANDRPDPVTHAFLLEHTTSPASTAMAKDLKKRGWTFVGPTTAYAFMQAMGLVNDHYEGCCVREEVEAQRAALARP